MAETPEPGRREGDGERANRSPGTRIRREGVDRYDEPERFVNSEPIISPEPRDGGPDGDLPSPRRNKLPRFIF
jgi:hypothetical protein